MNYKPVLSAIILLALVLPILAPLIPFVNVAQAQQVIISNVYGLTTCTAKDCVYPGDTITVEVYTTLTGVEHTVTVHNATTGYVYASRTFRPYEPGYVNVTLTLPKEFENLTEVVDVLGINVTWGPGLSVKYEKNISVLPMVEVSPSTITVVHPNGTYVNFTVTIYGLKSETTVSKILVNTYEAPAGVTANEKGVATVTMNISNLGLDSLPAGSYVVSFEASGYTFPATCYKNATLTIQPQVIIVNEETGTPEGRGIYIPGVGKGNIGNDTINITGYGFPANAVITRIQLVNTNFTGVYYEIPLGEDNKTDEYGYFSISDILQYAPTNMTAGLYIPVVYATVSATGYNDTVQINWNQTGYTTVDLAALGAEIGVPLTGYINATSQINVTEIKEYRLVNSTSSTVRVPISLDIVEDGYTYTLVANPVNTTHVVITLYNSTEIPWMKLWEDIFELDPYYKNVTVYFNTTQDAYSINPDSYKYKAVYYDYGVRIILELYKYVEYGVVSGYVTLVHTPTGLSKTYTYPDQLTVVDTLVKSPTWTFTVDNVKYEVSWSYNIETNYTNLTVTVSLPEARYEFRNVYYLVRPVLVFLVDNKLYTTYPTPVLPGENVTLIAFGYSPGKEWCVGDLRAQPWCAMLAAQGYENVLIVTLDMLTPLWSGPLGKDGNVTFTVTIPKDTTWGSHYIHGIDSRGYEYSVAIVVGAKAVFVVKLKPEVNTVTASYYDVQVTACPCAEYTGKTFCDVCVVYTGVCDYLGDYVRVTVSGLQPGEKLLKVYLGTTEVPKKLWMPTDPVADESGRLTFDFLVPSLPAGKYTIKVVTSVAGETEVSWEMNVTIKYVEVVPKILLVTLDSDLATGRAVLPILVGSGIVRVVGTGFKPGVSFDTLLVNMTDALRPYATNVRAWQSNAKGIIIGATLAGQEVYPAILFPVMQPGVYAISLTYYEGGELKTSEPGYIYVVNNLTFVATKEDVEAVMGAMISKEDVERILGAISDLSTTVNEIYGVVSDISAVLPTITSAVDSAKRDVLSAVADVSGKLDTAVSKIEASAAKLDDVVRRVQDVSTVLSTAVTNINNVATKVDSVSKDVSDVKSAVNALSGKLDTISDKVDTVGGKVDTVGGKVDAVSTKLGDVDTKVEGAAGAATSAMYVGIVALVFALIAAVFALLAYTTIKKSVAPK